MDLHLTRSLQGISLAAIFAACLSLSPAQAAVHSSSQYSITPVPSWVKPIDTPSARANAEVVGGERHLLVDRQYRDNGQQVAYHRHFVTDVVSQSGLSRASKLSISFDPNYERLELHSATVLRNAKVFDRLANARIDVARTEDSSEQNLLNGDVTAIVVLPDIRVGDQVEVRYTVIGRNPVFDAQHHSSWRTRWSVPVERSVLSITVPNTMNLTYTKRPAAKLSKEISSGLQTSQWRWEKHTASDNEQNTTDWHTNPDRMDVTAFNHWEEVAEWGAKLFAGHSTHSQEYNRLSQSLINRANNDGVQSAIAEAIDHVQKRIRYYGIELGENSHRPHSPDEVLKNGYGDCKDKVLLLVSLLDDLGVNAWPILVSARTKKGIVDRLPSPGVFDHAIVLIEHNGESYWVDATDDSQNGLLGYRGQPEYGAGLVLGKPGHALVTRDSSLPSKPTTSTHDIFYLSSFGGPVDFVTTTTYRGSDANRMRRRLDDSGKHRLEKNYKDYYQRMYGNLRKLDSFEINTNAIKNTISVTSSFRLSKFWNINQRSQQADFDAYAFVVDNRLEEFENIEQNRKAPLPIEGNTWVAHRIQYFPNVASNERALEESSFSIDGFSYQDSEYVIGDSRVFESDLKITTDEIDANRLEEYRKFRNRVIRNTSSGRHYRSVKADKVKIGQLTTTLLNELSKLHQ